MHVIPLCFLFDRKAASPEVHHAFCLMYAAEDSNLQKSTQNFDYNYDVIKIYSKVDKYQSFIILYYTYTLTNKCN